MWWLLLQAGLTISVLYQVYKQIYSRVPRLCVELVIKNNEGVLLTFRNIAPYKDFWHLPGGTVLLDETLEHVIKRVALEELGVGVQQIKFLGYIDFIRSKEEKIGRTISMAFLVKINHDNIKLDFQSSQYGFFQKFPENTIKEHKEFLLKNDQLSMPGMG